MILSRFPYFLLVHMTGILFLHRVPSNLKLFLVYSSYYIYNLNNVQLNKYISNRETIEKQY